MLAPLVIVMVVAAHRSECEWEETVQKLVSQVRGLGAPGLKFAEGRYQQKNGGVRLAAVVETETKKNQEGPQMMVVRVDKLLDRVGR